MSWFFFWLALCLGTQVWLCLRVSRTSVFLAIATFLLGPIGALYTLFKEHGEEETSVTTAFVANLACSVFLFMSGWQMLAALMEAPPEGQEGMEMAAAAEGGEPAAPQGLTPASLDVPPATAPALTQQAPADPLDLLATDLRSAGVQSTVQRMPAGSKLPEGVVSAAQLAMTGAPGTGAWLNMAAAEGTSAPAASPAGTAPALVEVSAIFLRCEAAAACRGVARAYMLQDAATRPRVLQNGPMLLLISNSNAAQAGHLHSVVASAFRHLPQQ
jgi:hypothetical protein